MLSERLQIIADKINKNESMADIGTDHGLLPISLLENNISPFVIMCDISAPSLAKAIKLGEPFGERAVSRVGNGLEVLNNGEVDNVVIAGMGGLTIINILNFNLEKTFSFKRLILQPRNNSSALRYWLASNGFSVIGEDLVREGKFICEIITVDIINSYRQMNKPEVSPQDGRWEIPELMIANNPVLVKDFAALRHNQDMKRKVGLQNANSLDLDEIATVTERMEYFADIFK